MASAWILLVKKELAALKAEKFKGKIMMEAIKRAKAKWAKIKKVKEKK